MPNDSEVISFNLPISGAREGDFSGANDNAFAHATPETDDHEIFISIDALLMSPVSNYAHLSLAIH